MQDSLGGGFLCDGGGSLGPEDSLSFDLPDIGLSAELGSLISLPSYGEELLEGLVRSQDYVSSSSSAAVPAAGRGCGRGASETGRGAPGGASGASGSGGGRGSRGGAVREFFLADGFDGCVWRAVAEASGGRAGNTLAEDIEHAKGQLAEAAQCDMKLRRLLAPLKPRGSGWRAPARFKAADSMPSRWVGAQNELGRAPPLKARSPLTPRLGPRSHQSSVAAPGASLCEFRARTYGLWLRESCVPRKVMDYLDDPVLADAPVPTASRRSVQRVSGRGPSLGDHAGEVGEAPSVVGPPEGAGAGAA